MTVHGTRHLGYSRTFGSSFNLCWKVEPFGSALRSFETVLRSGACARRTLKPGEAPFVSTFLDVESFKLVTGRGGGMVKDLCR